MTNGQLAQFDELGRCHLSYSARVWVLAMDCLGRWGDDFRPLTKTEKAWLRRLWHQYRHQIRAMRRNRR
jgi:hypothetical protein